MKGFASRPSESPDYVAPTSCPVCRSTTIVTTAKSPDAESYWRCTKCGEVFNASRSQTDRFGAPRWR